MNHGWNADQLLTRYFDTPIRFYLYDRILDLTAINTEYDKMRGIDSEGKRHRLHKYNILFAFPVEKMPDVKPHIKMHTSIKNLKLKPDSIQENRFCVDESELESVVGNNIVIFMRAGHVIHGELQAFDKSHLFMRVGNKVVLVYRHGVFNFKKETVPSQTKTNDLHELASKFQVKQRLMTYMNYPKNAKNGLKQTAKMVLKKGLRIYSQTCIPTMHTSSMNSSRMQRTQEHQKSGLFLTITRLNLNIMEIACFLKKM